MPDVKMPFFKFFPADFLTDTMAMPVETRGLYITLLCYQWLNGSIPADDAGVARICSITTAELQPHLSYIDEKFVNKGEHNRTRVNRRLERERQRAHAFRESRAAAGRKSGEQRRKKARTKDERNRTIHSSESHSEKPVSASQTSRREHPFGDLLGDSDNNKMPLCPHEKIVDLYHKILPEKPEVRVLNEKRKKHLRARWREDPKRQKLEWWTKYFEHIRTVPFLMTGGNTDWPGADFDFMINATKIVKIIEGSYER